MSRAPSDTRTGTSPNTSRGGGWGPTVHGGRKRGRVGTFLRRLGAVLLVVLLLAGLTGLAVLFYASSKIERVAVEGTGGQGGPLQVLVVGSDSREGLTPEERQELSTGSIAGDRTDTIFLMTISGGRVGLLAFPRDLYVTRCDGSEGRINTAMGVGGPGCLVQTVSTLSGIDIDHYMAINFPGFRDIVDAVGGVEICLDEPIADRDAGIDLPAGCQILDGAQALGYVRVRKIDNDLERIKRQQKFLQALASEIMSPSTLVDVPALFRTSGRVGEALTADERLGTFDLARMGLGMRGLATGAFVAETVPARGTNVGGAAVLLPVEEEAAPVFAAFRDGSVLDRAVAGDGPAPQDVSVAVLNGAGVEGLAGQTADALEARGFEIVEIGNAEPVDATVVRHPPGAEAEARVVAREVGRDVTVEEDDGVAAVTLVLGRDRA